MDMTSALERRIILLGKTGDGKSSTANTLLREQVFIVGHIAESTTRKCMKQEKICSGKKIVVVDTPGFFDTKSPEKEMNLEMARCVTMCSQGLHAFLIVLKVGTYTIHEEQVVQKITDTFGEEAFKYAVVLFTRGDQLTDDQTINSFVKTNDILQALVQKCGGRCHVIDNKYWNQEHDYRSNRVQMEKLMNTIEEMVRQNGGQCYTNEMLNAFEAAIKTKEEAVQKESNPGITDSDRRLRAEEEVAWEIQAAGFGTGALLGALLGIPVAIGAGALCIIKGPEDLREFLRKIAGTTVALAGGGLVTAAGASVGGAVGLNAAKNAKSVREAVQLATGAVVDVTKGIFGRK